MHSPARFQCCNCCFADETEPKLVISHQLTSDDQDADAGLTEVRVILVSSIVFYILRFLPHLIQDLFRFKIIL